MQLTNEYIRRRDISQLSKEDLEDILYNLQNMRNTLMHKKQQIEKDLDKIAVDEEMIKVEMEKRQQQQSK